MLDLSTGRIYSYNGASAPPGPVDLSTQNFESGPWTLIASPTDLSLENYADTTKWTAVLDGVELATMDYSDTSVWTLVGLDRVGAPVEAYVDGTGINATGQLTLEATSTQTIEAIVLAGAVAIGGGGSTGVAVSGAGVYTENRIATDVRAGIDGDGGLGIVADGITIAADDQTVIRSIAGAASIAAGIGGSTGVAVSIGLAIAINLVSNQSLAFIKDASGGVDVSGGDLSITATSGSGSLVNTTLTATSSTTRRTRRSMMRRQAPTKRLSTQPPTNSCSRR